MCGIAGIVSQSADLEPIGPMTEALSIVAGRLRHLVRQPLCFGPSPPGHY